MLFNTLGSGKVKKVQQCLYDDAKAKLFSSLQEARFVGVCLDIWTTKGMTQSYLGITVAWFCPTTKKSRHALLSLAELEHPHTAERIRLAVDGVLEQWQIPMHKVLALITDNGSNMIAAFKNTGVVVVGVGANDEAANEPDGTDDEDEVDDGDDAVAQTADENIDNEIDDHDGMEIQNYRHFACLPHTLQLVVKIPLNSQQFKKIITKVKHIVHSVKKSSKATEMLLRLAGKGLLSDCPTRWNSTYDMIVRIIELKEPLARVLESQNWDGIANTEWQKLQMFVDLLKPFSEHTDKLQGDNNTLSSIVPATLDMQCFLEQVLPGTCVGVAREMKASLSRRTLRFFDVHAENFEPLPAAASYLDPTVLVDLQLDQDRQELLVAAKNFITRITRNEFRSNQSRVVTQDTVENPSSTSVSGSQPQSEPAKKFKYFSQKVALQANHTRANEQSPLEHEFESYEQYVSRSRSHIIEIEESNQQGISFWIANELNYPVLAPLAMDILSLPASEASTERIFSHCGDFTRGKRNRTRVTLERSVFLKVNKDIVI